MNDRPHTRIAPLTLLQSQVASRSPWVLIDPALRAECIATYRAIRLLAVALFTLIGHPLCSRADIQNSAAEIQRFHAGNSHESEMRGASRRQESHIEPLNCVPGALVARLRAKQDALMPQLVRLKVYRAHAPPRGEIPDKDSAGYFLPVGESHCLPHSFAIVENPSTAPGSVTPFHLSCLPSVHAARPHPSQLHLSKGDHCHVCC